MGFQATVLDRVDYRTKQAFSEAKTLQFLWSPSRNFETEQLSIFTHCMGKLFSHLQL